MAASEDQLAHLLRAAPPASLGGVDFDGLTRTVRRRRRRATVLTAAAASVVLGVVAVVGVDAVGLDRADRGLATILSPTPSAPAPSAAPTPEPGSESPLEYPKLVLTADGTAAYYGFGLTRATKIVDLVPPSPGARAQGASKRCVLWDTPDVVCYRDSGDARGVVIGGLGPNVQSIAVSSGGDRLAWIDPGSGPTATSTVKFANLGATAVSGVVTIEPSPGEQPGASLQTSPTVIAWAGDDTLALTLYGDGDAGSGLVLQSLDDASVAAGWLAARRVEIPQADQATYSSYDKVVSAGSGYAHAVERESSCCWDQLPHGTPATRAVTVSLPDGAVLGPVLGTGDREAYRFVYSVVGFAQDTVYVTHAMSDPYDSRVYLRRGDVDRSTLIEGLPSSVVAVAF